MAYDNPDRRTYTFGNFDFGAAANETFSIQGPKGKAGRLIDYGVQGVIEVFAGGTSTPIVAVGTPSDADAYGDEFDLGALADNSGKSVRTTYPTAYPTGTTITTYILNQGKIPADQEVVLTCTGATGAGITGQAVPFVTIDWDW